MRSSTPQVVTAPPKRGQARWGWQLAAAVPLFAFSAIAVLPLQLLLGALDLLPGGDTDPGRGHAAPAGVTAAVTVLSVATVLAAVFALFLAHRLLRRRSPADIGMPISLGGIGRFLLGGVLGCLPVAAAWYGLFLTGLVHEPVAVWQARPDAVIIPAVILLCLGFAHTGIVEEGVFRSWLPVVLARKVPVWLAVGIASVAFSLLHLFSTVTGALHGTVDYVAYFTYAAVFGVIMATIYHATGSLWLIAGIHWTHNAMEGILGIGLSPEDAVFISSESASANMMPMYLVLMGSLMTVLAVVISVAYLGRSAGNVARLYGRHPDGRNVLFVRKIRNRAYPPCGCLVEPFVSGCMTAQ